MTIFRWLLMYSIWSDFLLSTKWHFIQGESSTLTPLLCPALSCLVLLFLTLSSPALSCPVLPCPVCPTPSFHRRSSVRCHYDCWLYEGMWIMPAFKHHRVNTTFVIISGVQCGNQHILLPQVESKPASDLVYLVFTVQFERMLQVKCSCFHSVYLFL